MIIIGYQINIKKLSELVKIRNDADRLHELRKAEIWRLQKREITVTKLGALKEEDLKTKKLRREKKTLYLNTKENLQKYYKNTEAYNEAERLLTAKPKQIATQMFFFSFLVREYIQI